MSKGLGFSLTLLGVSVCLANAAFAIDSECHPGSVCFTNLPDIRNVACESEERYAKYTVLNNSHHDIRLGHAYIHRLEGDQFPFSHHLIKVLPPHDATDCFYGPFSRLGKGEQCNINIKINPEHVDCGHTIPVTGQIERELVLTYRTRLLNHHSISQVIGHDHYGDDDQSEHHRGFRMTILGSADSFSAVGDNICGPVEGDLICNAAQLSEEVDIAFTQDAAITQDLGFFSDYIQFVHMGDKVYRDGDPSGNPSNGDIVENAQADTLTAGINIGSLLDDNLKGNCNELPLYLTSDGDGNSKAISLNAGVYCFQADEFNPVKIDNKITFNGPGEFLFIVEHSITKDKSHEVSVGDALQVTTGVSFELNNVSAEEIIWAVGGPVRFSDKPFCGACIGKFPGSIITPYSFEAVDDKARWCVAGRVLAYDNNVILNKSFKMDADNECKWFPQ